MSSYRDRGPQISRTHRRRYRVLLGRRLHRLRHSGLLHPGLAHPAARHRMRLPRSHPHLSVREA